MYPKIWIHSINGNNMIRIKIIQNYISFIKKYYVDCS